MKVTIWVKLKCCKAHHTAYKVMPLPATSHWLTITILTMNGQSQCYYAHEYVTRLYHHQTLFKTWHENFSRHSLQYFGWHITCSRFHDLISSMYSNTLGHTVNAICSIRSCHPKQLKKRKPRGGAAFCRGWGGV